MPNLDRVILRIQGDHPVNAGFRYGFGEGVRGCGKEGLTELFPKQARATHEAQCTSEASKTEIERCKQC